jgi:hypothetical protein
MKICLVIVSEEDFCDVLQEGRFITFMEECRLRMFENRVLRIFGPKRDEITGE